MLNRPNIIHYCDHLLPYSATFVRSQAESLENFTPYYAGSRLISGLKLPEERTLVINQGNLPGKISELSYKLWGVAPSFTQKLRQLNPLLIHAHFGPDGVRALPLAQHLDIPLIVTFHGYGATIKEEYARRSTYSHRLYLQRKQLLQQKAQLFIAVSDFIKEKLLEQGFPADKIIVHYVGIDTDNFVPDPSVARQPVVLFVGRLVEKKGCEYLIRAMEQVQQRQPEVELVIIGDGILRPQLEQLAKAKLKRYRFLGIQPPESVRSWMNRSQVFSVPSVVAQSGDSEAFGIVFAEAQAMGLPVVSFASGGIPEAVAHGETGFLAAEGDWQVLAEYITHLFKEQNLWQQFSQKGQERVRTMFNLQCQTITLGEIYQDVIEKR